MACPYSCGHDDYCDMSCVALFCDDCIHFFECEISEEGMAACEFFKVL